MQVLHSASSASYWVSSSQMDASRARRGPHGTPASDGLFAALSRTDANHFLHGGNEDLPITNAPRLGCSHNCIHNHLFQVVRDDYFYLGFGEKVNHVFSASIEFGMATLPSEATDFTDGHTLNTRGVELLLHFV